MTNSLNSDSAADREFFERLLNTTTCEEWNENEDKDNTIRQAVPISACNGINPKNVCKVIVYLRVELF